jgi:hypothetical protein
VTDLATPPCALDTDLPAPKARVLVRGRPGVVQGTSPRRGVLVLFDDRAFGEWFASYLVVDDDGGDREHDDDDALHDALREDDLR